MQKMSPKETFGRGGVFGWRSWNYLNLGSPCYSEGRSKRKISLPENLITFRRVATKKPLCCSRTNLQLRSKSWKTSKKSMRKLKKRSTSCFTNCKRSKHLFEVWLELTDSKFKIAWYSFFLSAVLNIWMCLRSHNPVNYVWILPAVDIS